MERARKQGKIIGRGLGKKSREMEAKIIKLRTQGESIRMIAQKCNIPRSTVHSILSRKRNLNSDTKNAAGIYMQKDPFTEIPFSDKTEEEVQ